MRNILIGTLMLSATALAAPAFAQQATPAAPAPSIAPATPATVTPVSSTSVLSSNLVGLNVHNAANETVGEIKDLVLGTGNTLTGVILSVGGFLGLGEHYVVVDPSSLAVTYNDADKKWQASIAATADELKAAPAFKYEGKWQ